MCIIFSCILRLHENAESNSLKSKQEGAVNMRKKRHNIRKILLTLDYGVECIGCVLISLVFFVGDQFLLQRTLLSFGAFVYGIPIPIAYLLNESRIRNIVLTKGWLKAFVSIFYSSKKIKGIKRKTMFLSLHPQDEILPGAPEFSKGRVSVSFRKNKHKRNRCPSLQNTPNREDQNSIPKKTITTFQLNNDNIQETMSCHNESTHKEDHEPKMSDLERANMQPSEKYNNVKNDIVVHYETPPSDVHMALIHHEIKNDVLSPSKNKNYIKVCRKQESAINLIGSEDSDSASIIGHETEHSDGLSDVDVQLIMKSSFADDYKDKILEILFKKDFKVFSRTYVLRHLLHNLNGNLHKSDFLKYFNYLCHLEEFTQKDGDQETNLNLIISLVNAWHLCKIDTRWNNMLGDAKQDRESSSPNAKLLDERALERKRICKLMLLNVSLDIQYVKYLKELCDMEESDDVDEGVVFW